MKISNWLIPVLSILALSACNQDKTDYSAERETMYQVATLQSLMAGNYDGFTGIAELKKHGDTGLGTFERVNGEMIVLDGIVYQALGDGTVQIADDSETTPFSTVTFFDADITSVIYPFKNVYELESQLNGLVIEYGMNFIYALRLDVNASGVTFRSELPQEKPYGPLSEVLPDKQRSFTFDNMGGTVVAVYFPSFFAGQNTPGWHFHFISSDRQKGGHMLELSSSETSVAQLDATPYFNMYLPQDSTFSRRDLSEDMSEAIEAVERSTQ